MPLVITNLGPSTATNISVNFTIPSGVILSSTPSKMMCVNSSSLISCWVTPVRPGVEELVVLLYVDQALQVDSLYFYVNFNVSEKNLNSTLTDDVTVDLLVHIFFIFE